MLVVLSQALQPPEPSQTVARRWLNPQVACWIQAFAGRDCSYGKGAPRAQNPTNLGGEMHFLYHGHAAARRSACLEAGRQGALSEGGLRKMRLLGGLQPGLAWGV